MGQQYEYSERGIVSGSSYDDRPSLTAVGTANTCGVGVLRERCSLVEPATVLTLVDPPSYSLDE